MTVYKFEALKLQVTKSGKCVCGKRVTRSTTLEHTINPFNKNAKGEVKSRSEIWDELRKEATEWKQKPVFHSRVMGGNWDLYNRGIVVLSCGQQIPLKEYQA